MTNHEKTTREPLFHLTKRTNVSTRFAVIARVVAVLLGFLVSGLIVMLLSGKNPISVYSSMFKGAFGTPRRIWNLLNNGENIGVTYFKIFY